jgi:hypothetical protein
MNKLSFSFDDVVISKFCYDMDNQKIEVFFSGYYDIEKESFINKPCTFVIENWKEAKSKPAKNKKFDSLDSHIGVFSLILIMESQNDNLELTVNTIDDRYITLVFNNPNINLIQLSEN